MNKLIIWGATGQAIVLEELLAQNNVKIVALFDNNIKVKSPIDRVPIFYGKNGLNKWIDNKNDLSDYGYLVAIGGNNGRIRSEIGEMLNNLGLQPYTAIHKTAFVAYNTVIGKGSQILANANICAKVRIGAYCIINTNASVDHECTIAQMVHVGPGAKLAGCVDIKQGVFIGTNATILPRIKIGEYSIIGAGSVVTKDIPAYSVAVGNPAQLIKVNNLPNNNKKELL